MPKKLAQKEKGPLESLFNSSAARLLDFFVVFNKWDYSKTDIAECAEVSIRTVMRTLPYLEEHGIIKRTRTVGNAEMYQTNIESPIIQHLHKSAHAIATVDIDKELRRQGCEKKEQAEEKTETVRA